MINRFLTVLNLLLVITLFATFSFVSSESATANTSQIKACADKNSGALRISNKCKSSERRVSWNIRGQQGPQGAQGPQGVPGAQGPQGPSGSDANLKTKYVTLAYMGDPGAFSPCGAGGPFNTYSTYKVYSGFLYGVENLTSYFNWKSTTTCWVTLKVLSD